MPVTLRNRIPRRSRSARNAVTNTDHAEVKSMALGCPGQLGCCPGAGPVSLGCRLWVGEPVSSQPAGDGVADGVGSIFRGVVAGGSDAFDFECGDVVTGPL